MKMPKSKKFWKWMNDNGFVVNVKKINKMIIDRISGECIDFDEKTLFGFMMKYRVEVQCKNVYEGKTFEGSIFSNMVDEIDSKGMFKVKGELKTNYGKSMIERCYGDYKKLKILEDVQKTIIGNSSEIVRKACAVEKLPKGGIIDFTKKDKMF